MPKYWRLAIMAPIFKKGKRKTVKIVEVYHCLLCLIRCIQELLLNEDSFIGRAKWLP